MKAFKEIIRLGNWSEEILDGVMRSTSRMKSIPNKIARLSEQFMGIPYRESTMKGGMHKPEAFVVNLDGVDCFTFIDYVEAMRLSRSVAEFKENLKKVRYQSGVVAYKKRNHFFTDWIQFNKELVEDVTAKIGERATERIQKTLNLKSDGSHFLEGVKPRKRTIAFIPSAAVNERVIEALQTGDYAGIYTEQDGLDVSHVGIIIKTKTATLLRHASSLKANRKVIDQDLKEYLSGKPGLVVLRPREQ